MNDDSTESLLVATVGGTPGPIVASVLHWRPLRVYFIVSYQSSDVVQRSVKEIRESYRDFDKGRYEVVTVSNAERYTSIVAEVLKCDEAIRNWKGRVVVDFTGGTKAMSAALATTALRWRGCTFSYVGGTSRTNNGLGAVCSGAERVVETSNPWDELGIIAFEEARVLMRESYFNSAKSLLENFGKRLADASKKQELMTLANLCDGLAKWDNFEHKKAATKLEEVPKRLNDLRRLLGDAPAEALEASAKRILKHCKECRSNGDNAPSRQLVLDLIANAQRRMSQHRYDDATARLYRAVEAIAQLKLSERKIDTGRVPLSILPEDTRSDVLADASGDTCKLGLQQSWRLLEHLGDQQAGKFRELFGNHSALSARNYSILAHGFEAVGEAVPQRLLTAVLSLLPATEDELPKVCVGDL